MAGILYQAIQPVETSEAYVQSQYANMYMLLYMHVHCCISNPCVVNTFSRGKLKIGCPMEFLNNSVFPLKGERGALPPPFTKPIITKGIAQIN